MNTKRIVVSIVVGVLQGLTVSLACHGLGLDAHAFILLPLAAGAVTGRYFYETSNL
jgi:hypothetical protein